MEAVVEHAQGGHGGGGLFSFDPGVAIWTWVVFVVLLFLLKRFAWGPIMASIETREKNIRDSLEQAKEAQSESRRIAEEQNKILAEARAEAASIVGGAKNTAEELKRKIEHDAAEEKVRILESARKEIDAAKSAAIQELRKTSATLALDVAEKLVRKSMDDKNHKELVDKLLDELSAEKA